MVFYLQPVHPGILDTGVRQGAVISVRLLDSATLWTVAVVVGVLQGGKGTNVLKVSSKLG